MSQKLKHPCKRLLLLVLFVVIGMGGYVGYQVAEHNLHVVVPGQVYRSCRMSPEALSEVIQANGIKSILSLIGSNRDECETAGRLGVVFFGCSLSDRQEVTDKQMEKILATIRHAPKPVLIHCKAGADRTGLVAALYAYGVEGQPATVADDELTLRYGHLPSVLGFATSAMDRSYWRYVSHHVPGSATNDP